MVKTQTGWPGPWAQTAQPVRWRMRRWSKEPRRISVVEGIAAASLARAAGIAVCFTLYNETQQTCSCQALGGPHAPLNIIHNDETVRRAVPRPPVLCTNLRRAEIEPTAN